MCGKKNEINIVFSVYVWLVVIYFVCMLLFMYIDSEVNIRII